MINKNDSVFSKIVHNYFGIIFFCVFILIIVARLMSVSFANAVLTGIFLIVYYIISAFGYLSFVRSKFRRLSMTLMTLIAVFSVFFISDLYMLLPVLLVVFVIRLRDISVASKMVISFIHVLMAIVLLVGSLIYYGLINFVESTVLEQSVSPNGRHELVVLENDEGALGGSTTVYTKLNVMYIFDWKRMMYVGKWGDRPVVYWIDDSHVSIDSHKMNVYEMNNRDE